MGPVLDYQSKTSSPEADCVQVVTLDFVRPADQILDVVVLRMDVTAGERVRPPRSEHPDQAGRKVRRSPRRVVGEMALGHLRAYETGADQEDANRRLGKPVSKGLREAVHRGLARRVRRAARSGEVTGAAAGDQDAAPAALQHPRDHGAAAKVDAKDVDLERAPPL